MAGEVWKDIGGYEGLYQVSNLGRVRSVRRMANCPVMKSGTRLVRERILKPWRFLRKGKVLALGVDLSKNNKVKKFHIHKLVLTSFVGPCPDGMEACHFPDRDVTNNRLDNLRWDTHSNNEADKLIHGTDNRTANVLGVNRWTGEGCWDKSKKSLRRKGVSV